MALSKMTLTHTNGIKSNDCKQNATHQDDSFQNDPQQNNSLKNATQHTDIQLINSYKCLHRKTRIKMTLRLLTECQFSEWYLAE
jgi:hypothetical protein